MHDATRLTTAVEACVARFEAAWFAGGRVQLVDFLPRPEEPHYRDALIELACSDLELSWAAGERRLVEDYLAQFPLLVSDAVAVRLLAQQEQRARRDAGDSLSAEELSQRLGVEVALGSDLASEPRSESFVRPDHWRDRLAKLHSDYLRGDSAADSRHCLPPSELADSLPRFAAGSEFAGFRLLRELGRGTFGRVFLAEQPRLAGRRVVLKVGQRLYDESQRLAQLQHTNIVPIYSAHRVGEWQVLCMPFLGSTTLADVVARLRSEGGSWRSNTLGSTLRDQAATTLPSSGKTSEPAPGKSTLSSPQLEALGRLSGVQAALTVTRSLAEGLAHAHGRGIIHRDLKPANILLADDGTPRLLDFNLAADLSGPAGERAILGGTLPYMAPEQMEAILGRSGDPDARSDLYALGIILFELLIGRLPFATHTGEQRDVIERMLADRQGGAPHLLRELPGCSPAVAAIVARCLAPDPEARYAHAEHLAEDLGRQLADLPLVHTPEPSLVERGRKFVRRRPRLVGLFAAGLLTAIAVVVAVAAIGQSRRAERIEAVALRREFQEQLADARAILSLPFPSPEELAEGQADCLQALQRYGLPSDEDWQPPRPLVVLQSDEQVELRGELAEGLLLAARGDWQRSRLAGASSEREKAQQSGLALCAQAERLGAKPGDVASHRELLIAAGGESTSGEPSSLAAAGRFLEAIDAIEQQLRTQGDDAALWAQLGACQSAVGRTRDAVASYSTCLALRPTLWRAYFWRGQAHLELQEHSRATLDFSDALASHGNHVPSLALRALAHLGQGDAPAADADLTRAILLAPDHTRLYFMRARVRQARHDAVGARRDFEEGLKREPADELSWIARGIARLTTDPAGALADFDAALRLNPWSREAAQNKAHVLAERLGRPAEAVTTLDLIVERFPDYVIARIGRGVLLARQGKRDEARRDADESLRRDPRGLVAYQAACIHALNSREHPADAAEAIALLHRALRDGFGSELLANDPDLATVRETPAFQTLVNVAPPPAGSGDAKN